MRPSAGTLMAVEILTAPAVVSRYCLVKKNPPFRESEDAWFPSCLPSWLGEEGRRKTLSKKVKKC
jgi:hypothetical protein